MTAVTDRRHLRRQETIEQILRVSIDLMAVDGVAGLSLSAVARRIGVKPPSLYKYFPSKAAVYDALFERASNQTLASFRAAAERSEPGLAALTAGLRAIARLALDEPVSTQLVTWRPVPGFEPSATAFAPNVEFLERVRAEIVTAVRRGELGRGASSREGLALLSILVTGMVSQQLANEPETSFDDGRFTRYFDQVLQMFVDRYPARRKGKR